VTSPNHDLSKLRIDRDPPPEVRRAFGRTLAFGSAEVQRWVERPLLVRLGVAGFADAAGHFLPLVCTLNATRIFDATAALLDVDLAAFNRLALSAGPGAGGLPLVPYFDGERTPNLPDATGSLHGITRANYTPANVARAAVEGVVCSLADGLAALQDQGVTAQRILLVGGGAQSAAVQEVAASLLGTGVTVPQPGEYVADGAARQAAAALTGCFPEWAADAVDLPVGKDDDGVLARYRRFASLYA